MPTKSQTRRAEKSVMLYRTTFDMGQILCYSRKAMGLQYEYIAKCMGVPPDEWLRYEKNRKPIPGYIIIKLMIFGMEFWARNKRCFENEVTLPATCGGNPPAEGN